MTRRSHPRPGFAGRLAADLVAFMKALTGQTIEVSLPTLPPGPDGKSFNPADALGSPAPTTALDLREVHRAVTAR